MVSRGQSHAPRVHPVALPRIQARASFRHPSALSCPLREGVAVRRGPWRRRCRHGRARGGGVEDEARAGSIAFQESRNYASVDRGWTRRVGVKVHLAGALKLDEWSRARSSPHSGGRLAAGRHSCQSTKAACQALTSGVSPNPENNNFVFYPIRTHISISFASCPQRDVELTSTTT